MKKYSIKKIMCLVWIGAAVSVLGGCGAEENTGRLETVTERNTEQTEDQEESGMADLEGEVLSFSDTGLQLSKASVSEEMMIQAVSGSDEVEEITVTYSDQVSFQVKEISQSSQTVVDVVDGTKEDIKRETSVELYGESIDETHFVAEKVVVQRWIE